MPDATPARPCGSGGGPGQRCRWPGAGGLLGALRGTRENVPGGVQCPAVCARHTSDTCLRPGTAREPPKSRGEERLGDRLPSSRAGTPGRTVGSRTTVAATRRALGHLGDRSRRTGCALEAVTLPCALGWQPNPENARDQKTPAAKRAKPQPGPDLTGRAHEAGSTRWWRRAPGSPRRACALRLPPGASGSRVTPEVAGRARAGGAATFVIPCGRERESGAVEPPVSGGGGGGGGQGGVGRSGPGRGAPRGWGLRVFVRAARRGWARAFLGAAARIPRRPRPRRCAPAGLRPGAPSLGMAGAAPSPSCVVPEHPTRAARPPAQIAEPCGRKCGPRPSRSEEPVACGHTWVASGREPSRGIPEEAAGRPGKAGGPHPTCGGRPGGPL